MATLQNRVIILMRIPTVGLSFMTTFPITAQYFFQVAINGDPTNHTSKR